MCVVIAFDTDADAGNATAVAASIPTTTVATVLELKTSCSHRSYPDLDSHTSVNV